MAQNQFYVGHAYAFYFWSILSCSSRKLSSYVKISLKANLAGGLRLQYIGLCESDVFFSFYVPVIMPYFYNNNCDLRVIVYFWCVSRCPTLLHNVHYAAVCIIAVYTLFYFFLRITLHTGETSFQEVTLFHVNVSTFISVYNKHELLEKKRLLKCTNIVHIAQIYSAVFIRLYLLFSLSVYDIAV